jgi:hypothetical protein
MKSNGKKSKSVKAAQHFQSQSSNIFTLVNTNDNDNDSSFSNSSNNRMYELVIRQQPVRGRAIGFGEKDRYHFKSLTVDAP